MDVWIWTILCFNFVIARTVIKCCSCAVRSHISEFCISRPQISFTKTKNRTRWDNMRYNIDKMLKPTAIVFSAIFLPENVISIIGETLYVIIRYFQLSLNSFMVTARNRECLFFSDISWLSKFSTEILYRERYVVRAIAKEGGGVVIPFEAQILTIIYVQHLFLTE